MLLLTMSREKWRYAACCCALTRIGGQPLWLWDAEERQNRVLPSMLIGRWVLIAAATLLSSRAAQKPKEQLLAGIAGLVGRTSGNRYPACSLPKLTFRSTPEVLTAGSATCSDEVNVMHAYGGGLRELTRCLSCHCPHHDRRSAGGCPAHNPAGQHTVL
jgi:hypothetical protein